MREIVKLAALAAVILITAVLVALFASGYISAFKPGGAKDAPGEHVTGGGGGSMFGGAPAVSTPAPSPSVPPMPEMAESGAPPYPENIPGMPGQLPQEPVNPALMQGPPGQCMPPDLSSPGQPGMEPGPRIIQDRPPGMPPFEGPIATPLPPSGPPAIQGPSATQSPFVLGWMQIIQRFVTILSDLFPGIAPVITWWPPGL